MELGVFVVAFALIAGVVLLGLGRVSFPVRGGRPAPDEDVRTAEPAGHVDDAG